MTVHEIFMQAEQSRFLKVPHIKKLWELVDDPALFKKTPDALEKLRLGLSRDALRFFKEHSSYYAQLLENMDIDPASAELEDMAKLMVTPVELLNRLLGTDSFLWHADTVDSVTCDRAYSSGKAATELGYRPRYTLELGLRETVDLYRENGFI